MAEASSRDTPALAPDAGTLRGAASADATASGRPRHTENAFQQAFLDLSAALASTLDIHDLLLAAVERVALELGSRRVSLVVVPPGESEANAFVLVSSDEAALRNLIIDLSRYPELVHTLHHNAVTHLSDPSEHPLLETLRRDAASIGFDLSHLGPALLVPLRIDQRPVGALFVRQPAGAPPFESAAIDFCRVLANMLALALHSARILRRLESVRIESDRPHTADSLTPSGTLPESLTQAARAYHAVDAAVALMDPSGKLHFANYAARRLLGYDQDALGSLSGEDLVIELDVPAYQHMRRLLDSEAPLREVELRLLGGNGEIRHCQVTFARLPGRLDVIVLTLRDIGPGRLRDKTLERTRMLLEAIVQLSRQPIMAFDSAGRLRLLNHAAESLLALPARDALEAVSLSDLEPTGSLTATFAELAKSRPEGIWRLSQHKVELRDHYGRTIPLELSAMSLAEGTADGGVVCLVEPPGLTRGNRPRGAGDTTSHPALPTENDGLVLLLQQRAASNATAQALVEAMRSWMTTAPFPIALLGADSQVEASNAAFRRVLFRAGSSHDLTHLRQAVIEQDQPALERALDDAAGGRLWNQADVRIGAREDALAHLRLNLYRRESDDDAYQGTLLLAIDLSELDALEEQVLQAEKLASLGQLAAGVVHELNNPLTSISVYSDYLLAKYDREPAASGDVEKIRRIVDATGRMLRFTRDLVAYARPSEDAPLTVSINEVIEQSVGFCEHVLTQTSTRLIMELGDDAGEVLAVPEQLQQVFVNLVTNACQALEPGQGTVRVVTRSLGRLGVAILVEDDGPGIPERNRERIFEPFFSTKRDGGGTGLGLAIVRNIIHQQGGSIEVESQLGRGTRFTIRLARRISRARRATRQMTDLD